MMVLFVGLSGVPYLRRACDNRIMAFAQLFAEIGYKVSILNRTPVKKKKEIELDLVYHSDIDFVESLSMDKPAPKMLQLLIHAISYLFEFIKILRMNRVGSIDLIHVYSGHFFEFIIYRMISKVVNAKLIYQYVEFRSAVDRKSLYHKINGYLCDRYLHWVFDGIISISDFLTAHIRNRAPDMPLIKIPPLCDFAYFNSISSVESPARKYIFYCGSAGYFEVIQLIIDSYKQSSCMNHEIDLVMVVNGSSEEMLNVFDYVSGNHSIKIKTNLHYESLIQLYKNALLCMIPLRDTIQDIARFPNKIGEYCASSCAFITTSVGDIPEYFIDKQNALLIAENSVETIADKIDWAILNESRLAEIRRESYKTGVDFFDLNSHRNKLEHFAEAVCSS